MLVVLFSYFLVRHANTRPGYDPYGWLIWGYQTLHLSLDLGGAPSWKPLPFLFTVPLSLFGTHALTLWMTFATAVSLSGSIFAGRIAYRLTLPSDGEVDTYTRWAAVAAGVFAGLAVLGINQWIHLFLSAQSDTIIVALCLGAIDMHLSGHPRWAYALLVLAALGRPEAWPFTGLYFLWAWRAIPAMRKFLAFGLVLIPVMWFGVPTITNARPFVSAELAELSVRRIEGNKFIGVFHRYTALTYLPIQLLALLSVVIAAFRRNRTVLVLAGAAVLWMIVEMAFVLHGWPGVPRYMIESAGVQTVLAGVARRLDPRRPPEAAGGCAVVVGPPLDRGSDRRADRRRARAGRDRAGARRAQGPRPRARPDPADHAARPDAQRSSEAATTSSTAAARRRTSASSASWPTSRT